MTSNLFKNTIAAVTFVVASVASSLAADQYASMDQTSTPTIVKTYEHKAIPDIENATINVTPPRERTAPISHSPRITAENVSTCCALGCGAIGVTTVAGLLVGAVIVPPILAYHSDQSKKLSLVSAVVNSVYLYSLCLDKKDDENSNLKIIINLSKLFSAPLQIIATTYSWLYFVHNDNNYYREVNIGTTSANACVLGIYIIILGCVLAKTAR